MNVQLLNEVEEQADQQVLPDRYLGLSEEELDVRIGAARSTLGERLLILGHHYQRDEVFKFADDTGDSFKLAKVAAARREADFIVLCGVHFMAESADVLSAEHQKVVLPDLAAGCSMADMAVLDELEVCWDELSEMGIHDIVPVTYMNSAASIKAFCGQHGGTVCTSSNAVATFQWAWNRGARILFLPDQHLGRNTAFGMGVPLQQMCVWDPNVRWGGLEPSELHDARMILWKGHCSVHTKFTVEQIERLRASHPDIRIISHPECTLEVIQASDEVGSTSHIIRQVTESPAGSIWGIGTEIHLVNRLAQELAPERTVMTLDAFGCLCSTMYRVSPNHLCWVLEGLVNGEVRNQVSVPDDHKRWTRVALDRMLSIQ